MAYRNKTYVCFDADQDMNYYTMLLAWSENDKFDFEIYNAHEINNLRKYSNEETIKRKLLERLKNSKVMIVLVGEKTKNLYKYVRWEIEKAIELDIPIIAVNIVKDSNGKYNRKLDDTNCPKILKETMALHVAFREKILSKAIEEWPSAYKDPKYSYYYYEDYVYRTFGIM